MHELRYSILSQFMPVNNIIPDWNELVYEGDWKNALKTLHSTNNFPEFTGEFVLHHAKLHVH